MRALKGGFGLKSPGVKRTLNAMRSDPSGLEPAPVPPGFGVAGGDVLRTLAQLTKDVERFDSMIRNQRHLLQRHGADPEALDPKLIRRQSRRITVCGTEIVTLARGALGELCSLLEISELSS